MQVLNTLLPYQQRVQSLIEASFERLGYKSVLRQACEYALKGAGKRFRPALVFMVADALSRGCDASESALAIEFFHTASLVADDLPSMDNDSLRRGAPTVHKKFGEATALLVTYALIAEGYACIARNAKRLNRPELCVLALENATKNTGVQGATGGQFLDIAPPDLSEQMLREIIQKKTGSLFEVAFVFGWLFGGGAPEKLDLVQRAASHYGMAFQIADDFGDVEQDRINGRLINMVAVVGLDRAAQVFHEELLQYNQLLETLNLHNSDLFQLGVSLNLN